MAVNGVDTMWFLPSALNVNVMKFAQARVNGGSNYDSLKLYLREIVGRELVIRVKPASRSEGSFAGPQRQDNLERGRPC